MATCKSCQAEIVWAFTEEGKLIPLDPGTFEDGNLRIIGGVMPDGRPIVTREGKPTVKYVQPGHGNRRTHFASCPNAKSHRRTP